MKRAFALVLASLALAYAQEAAPADPKAAAVHKPSTEAKPEPAAEVKPEEETIQKPRKPMLKVRPCVTVVPACRRVWCRCDGTVVVGGSLPWPRRCPAKRGLEKCRGGRPPPP